MPSDAAVNYTFDSASFNPPFYPGETRLIPNPYQGLIFNSTWGVVYNATSSCGPGWSKAATSGKLFAYNRQGPALITSAGGIFTLLGFKATAAMADGLLLTVTPFAGTPPTALTAFTVDLSNSRPEYQNLRSFPSFRNISQVLVSTSYPYGSPPIPCSNQTNYVPGWFTGLEVLIDDLEVEWPEGVPVTGGR
jgi:hypothetical protein